MHYYLSPKEKTILIILFTYRGMRAKDLAVFYTESYTYTLADEKSVYNYLLKMKKKGFIKATRLQGINSLGSIYYLTPVGHELAKEILNISVGQQGTGFLPVTEETVFWDVPFEYQTPPLKQTDHFLMTIEFFKQLIASDEFFYHLTTYYSNLTYYLNQKEYKVKPDAAVIINDNFYAVEMDRATESHDQLLAKFQKYKEYHDFCERVEDKSTVTPVHTILFVVEARSRQHGIKRRWTNVLSAFFKAFGEDFPSINLILVPLNEVGQTLEFELYRVEKEKDIYESYERLMAKNGFDIVKTLENKKLYFNKENQFYTPNNQLHLEFESRTYKDNYNSQVYIRNFTRTYKHLFEPGKALDSFQYLKEQGASFSPFNTPKFPEGIETTNIHPSLLKKMDFLKNYINYYLTLSKQ